MNPAALAHLRFPVAQSRGRRYPEVPHPYRNDFQRDRDRVVHARAFRRLEDKTQVFAPDLSDHFRNRLTHTIEVAQIARTVAGTLGLDEDLTEALALAHDIGHPPFGHAGEHELDRQMQRFGSRFDHNLHALHIVESFEQRYAMFPGLNLTFELREGIVKHSRDIEPGAAPELAEFLPGLRPPLEAQLIDLADEIAYDTSDLDDGNSAGLFDAADLAARVPAFAELNEEMDMQYPGAPERIRFLECVRRLVNSLVSSLIVDTAQAAAGCRDVDDVRSRPRLAQLTDDGQQTMRALKAFLHERVYSSPSLFEERQQSIAAVAKLFNYLLDHPEQLPEYYRERNREAPPHRVVCDYIAGMTDGFLRRMVRSVLW